MLPPFLTCRLTMPAGKGPEAGASAGALRRLLLPGAFSWMLDTIDAGAAAAAGSSASKSAAAAGDAADAAAASFCCSLLEAEQGPAAVTKITRRAKARLRPIEGCAATSCCCTAQGVLRLPRKRRRRSAGEQVPLLAGYRARARKLACLRLGVRDHVWSPSDNLWRSGET